MTSSLTSRGDAALTAGSIGTSGGRHAIWTASVRAVITTLDVALALYTAVKLWSCCYALSVQTAAIERGITLVYCQRDVVTAFQVQTISWRDAVGTTAVE